MPLLLLVIELDPRSAALLEQVMGSPPVRVESLRSGLGAHRFLRVACRGGARAIARIDTGRQAGSGPEPPLEGIRAFFEKSGIPVPRRYGAADGIEILEDLGDDSLLRHAEAEHGETLRHLYGQACSLIGRIQSLATPTPPLPAFERRLRDFLPRKLQRTLEVSLPGWLGREPSPGERECVERAFEVIDAAVAASPCRLSHRDFQSSNLMVRDGALFLIDLQGALLAPPEYDLVCLLRDSYVELSEPWVDQLAESTRTTLPDRPETEVFRHRFDLLTIARKAKDDAFFLEAARRGETRYLAYRETNRRYLAAAAGRLAAAHSCFAGWCEWLEPRGGVSACAR